MSEEKKPLGQNSIPKIQLMDLKPEVFDQGDIEKYMFVLQDEEDGHRRKLDIKGISMWIYYMIYNLVRFFFIVIYFYLFPFLVVLYSLVYAYEEFVKTVDEGSSQYAIAVQGRLAQKLIDLVS